MELPADGRVEVAVLGRLFNERTNSYKFFFFLALLDEVSETEGLIPYRRLAAGMCAWAWFPHFVCRLSLGSQDRMGEAMQRARELLPDARPFYDRNGLRERKRVLLDCPALDLTMLRYVKQRILRPWFEGLPEGQVDHRLASLSRERFEERRPLFRLEREGLQPHPDWAGYLRQNHQVVQGWACWHLARFLQQRNPSVPGVVHKLIPPLERQAMAEQQLYWRRLLAHGGYDCIYSGERLSSGSFALDHFLPWSFVAHNLLWNLVPVTSRANSSKGDRLPADLYLDRLAQVQARGLCESRQLMRGDRRWLRLVEPFVADLRMPALPTLPAEEVLPALRAGYRTVFPPLLALARQNGFGETWRY